MQNQICYKEGIAFQIVLQQIQIYSHKMSVKSMAKLSRILIFGHDIEETAILYTMTFRLKIQLQSSKYLELTDGSQKIAFYKVNQFAQQTKGYSPILWFNVKNFEETKEDLLKYGAKMEEFGVKEDIQVGMFRGINGEMISVYQGEESQELESQQQKDDELMSEVKNILGKLKF